MQTTIDEVAADIFRLSTHIAVDVSLNDLADRPPRAMGDSEGLDTGGHRLRFVPTPHVPHNWDSGLWFDETTRTLLAGDLFTQVGAGLVADAAA